MTDEAQEAVEGETQDITNLNNPIDIFNEPEESDTPDDGEKGETETEETETDSTEDATESEDSESESPSEKGKLVTEKALLGERDRRKKAQAEANELRQQLAEYQAAQDKENAPDPEDDPEGYAAWVQDTANRDRVNDKINMSRDIMVDQEEDYEEMESIFMGLVSDMVDGQLQITDQSLHQKFYAASNPARFAYNHAKEHLRKENLGKENTSLKQELDDVKAELEKLKSGKLSDTEVPNLTNAAAQGNNSVDKPSETVNPKDLF